jgi:hypothetical protein
VAAEDVVRQARALQRALEDSGWFDLHSLQEALYQWAESGLSVTEVRSWLAAEVVRAADAEAFRELGIGAEQVRAAQLGERVSTGTLPIEDAARQVLGAVDLGEIRRQARTPRLAAQPAGADEAAPAGDGLASWRGRLQRVAGLAEAIPADLRDELQTEVGKVPDGVLVEMRDVALAWSHPVTIAVALQELQRLANLRFARLAALPSLGPSAPLFELMLGSVAAEERNRRLAQRVEAAIAQPPTYLLSMLGPYPASAAAQLIWIQAAVDVEDFRVDYQITDPDEALGAADREMLLVDQRERFHALNRSLAQARIDLDRGEPGNMVADAAAPDGLGAITWHKLQGMTAERAFVVGSQQLSEDLSTTWGYKPSSAAADPRATDPAPTAGGSRPDERLTMHLRGLAPHLPGATRAAAASLPDTELAARWQAAMAAQGLAHDLGPPTKLQFHTEVGVAPDGGPFQPDHPHPDRPILLAPAPLLEAAAVLEELDRRVEARMEAAIAEPPTYILRTLGSWPHHPGYSAVWEVMAAEIERYRLLTGTTDPTFALGQPAPPGNSWQQCWRRALTQDLAQCGSTWMRHRHSVFGSEGDRADVLHVAASTSDHPSVRPAAALLADHEDLSTATLRFRVVDAAALLSDWPPDRSGELATARNRYTTLARCAQEQRLLLAAARTRLSRPGLAITPRARAARAALKASIREREQAVTRLDERLAATTREVVRLQRAQDAYVVWRDEHAPLLAQGQAAAQVLQAREDRLLDELAASPPAYLLAELGSPPANPEGRAAWRGGVRALERFRATYRIYDPDRTFADDLPAVVMTRRHREAKEQMTKAWDRVHQAVDAARRAITDSLAREHDQGPALPGPGGGPPGLIEP